MGEGPQHRAAGRGARGRGPRRRRLGGTRPFLWWLLRRRRRRRGRLRLSLLSEGEPRHCSFLRRRRRGRRRLAGGRSRHRRLCRRCVGAAPHQAPAAGRRSSCGDCTRRRHLHRALLLRGGSRPLAPPLRSCGRVRLPGRFERPPGGGQRHERKVILRSRGQRAQEREEEEENITRLLSQSAPRRKSSAASAVPRPHSRRNPNPTLLAPPLPSPRPLLDAWRCAWENGLSSPPAASQRSRNPCPAEAEPEARSGRAQGPSAQRRRGRRNWRREWRPVTKIEGRPCGGCRAGCMGVRDRVSGRRRALKHPFPGESRGRSGPRLGAEVHRLGRLREHGHRAAAAAVERGAGLAPLEQLRVVADLARVGGG